VRVRHATELARQAMAERRELVIAAGGDCTMNEARTLRVRWVGVNKGEAAHYPCMPMASRWV
jgi:hypothetical protein